MHIPSAYVYILYMYEYGIFLNIVYVCILYVCTYVCLYRCVSISRRTLSSQVYISNRYANDIYGCMHVESVGACIACVAVCVAGCVLQCVLRCK